MFEWHPGIGDPTFYGWMTVAAYGVASLCCAWASRRSSARERGFWLLLAIVMGFLCINKQLDLQSLLTNLARYEAKAHGWYEHRRPYQVAFVVALGVVSTVFVLALLGRLRRASIAARGALAGLVLLVLFVMVRASSFDKVDWIINRNLAGARTNHFMELGGIAIVTVFAIVSATGRTRRRLRSA